MQKGRYEEAEAILIIIAQKNQRPPPDFTDLARIREEERAQETAERKYTYLNLFNTWHYCKITLVQLLAWYFKN